MGITITIHEHHVDIMEDNHNIIRHTIDFGDGNAKERIIAALERGESYYDSGEQYSDVSIMDLVEKLNYLEENRK